jgi:hypothetical protein
MPEVILQHAIKKGLNDLKNDPAAFNDIFGQFTLEELDPVYGQSYIDGLYGWFESNKLSVVQAFSFDVSKVPCYSIHLASEQEDESKAAIGDIFSEYEGNEMFSGPVSVTLDIGIHAMKDKDHVLWMYYLLNYILYKQKIYINNLGLQLHTFSASDYNKESKYMAENVWSRWVRFRCIVQHYWDGEMGVDHNVNVRTRNGRSSDPNDDDLV